MALGIFVVGAVEMHPRGVPTLPKHGGLEVMGEHVVCWICRDCGRSVLAAFWDTPSGCSSCGGEAFTRRSDAEPPEGHEVPTAELGLRDDEARREADASGAESARCAERLLRGLGDS